MSRQKLKYTPESLVWVFEQYMKVVGMPWSPEWSWSRPPNWTEKQKLEVLGEIHRRYEKKFPDLVIRPITDSELQDGKTGLHQQLQWTITPQSNSGKMTRQLRLAAYEAGFLMMSDIVLLEQLQRFNSK